jgi:hypothetical protein
VIDNSPPIIYHWVDTSTGGLLVLEGSIPLLVDYYLSLGRYLYWWTIIYHWVDTSDGGAQNQKIENPNNLISFRSNTTKSNGIEHNSMFYGNQYVYILLVNMFVLPSY